MYITQFCWLLHLFDNRTFCFSPMPSSRSGPLPILAPGILYHLLQRTPRLSLYVRHMHEVGLNSYGTNVFEPNRLLQRFSIALPSSSLSKLYNFIFIVKVWLSNNWISSNVYTVHGKKLISKSVSVFKSCVLRRYYCIIIFLKAQTFQHTENEVDLWLNDMSVNNSERRPLRWSTCLKSSCIILICMFVKV